MKEIYLLRHTEKDADGILTKIGIIQAKQLAKSLPTFAMVYSSPSERAQLTASLLSGEKPQVDHRADFYMASPAKSDALNNLASTRQIPFLAAVQEYGDSEVLTGVEIKATGLNALIDELIVHIQDDEKGLIVSHDLSISPAMAQRGIALASINFLSGYVVNEIGNITAFEERGSI